MQRRSALRSSPQSNDVSHSRQSDAGGARDHSGSEDTVSSASSASSATSATSVTSTTSTGSGNANHSDARNRADHVDQGSSLYNRKVANTTQDIDSSKAALVERRTEEKKPNIIKTSETSEVSIRLIFFCFLISFLYFTLPLCVFIFVILIVSSLLLYVKRTNESSA